jgi:hypothetical protein
MSKTKLFILLPSVTAIISLLPLPYGFYSLTRTIFSICFGYVAFRLYEANILGWLIFLGLVILYNPILPVHLGSKAIWVVINFIGLGFLVFYLKDGILDKREGN